MRILNFFFYSIVGLIVCSCYAVGVNCQTKTSVCREPRVLFVYKKACVNGGVGGLKNTQGVLGSVIYKINVFKHLCNNGVAASMLIVDEKNLYEEYRTRGMSVYYLPGGGACDLATKMEEICIKENINVIHCSTANEVEAALKVAKHLQVRVVMTAHCEIGSNIKYLRGVRGVVCVSWLSQRKLAAENERQKLGIRTIKFLAPFFDEDAYLNFKTNRSRADFFKKEFNIAIKNVPLISMVANFYLKFKDHATVIRAAQKLIQDEHIPVQVAFAGCGSSMKTALKLAKDLHISDNVYFLGHTDSIPELFYHTDISVLSSTSEAFGKVLLEASLMKKPLVGTRGTGMESMVKHEQTGLLFKMRDANELAACFKRLIQDKAYAAQLGNAAYNFTIEHYVSQATVRELLEFYQEVLQG